LLLPYKDKVKTLTFDNGSEFVQHKKVAKALDAKTYFAHPYSSWERGINENTNGLLRQFFQSVRTSETQIRGQILNLEIPGQLSVIQDSKPDSFDRFDVAEVNELYREYCE